MFVVTADQIGSRAEDDLVPAALEALGEAPLGVVRPFERTAGDEIQGLLDDPTAVVHVVERLLEAGPWRIGIGIGSIELPLPATTRAGRGPVYQAARRAVEAAHPLPWQLAVRLGDDVDASLDRRGTRARHAEYAETALLLLSRLLRGRTPQGWEVTKLLDEGRNRTQAAGELGISVSAVSQRIRRAGWEEQHRGVRLAAHHLSVADGRPALEEGSGDDDDAGVAGRSDRPVGRVRGVPRQSGHPVGVRGRRPA